MRFGEAIERASSRGRPRRRRYCRPPGKHEVEVIATEKIRHGFGLESLSRDAAGKLSFRFCEQRRIFDLGEKVGHSPQGLLRRTNCERAPFRALSDSLAEQGEG